MRKYCQTSRHPTFLIFWVERFHALISDFLDISASGMNLFDSTDKFDIIYQSEAYLGGAMGPWPPFVDSTDKFDINTKFIHATDNNSIFLTMHHDIFFFTNV